MARHTYLTMKTPDEARELWFSRIEELGMEAGEEEVLLPSALRRVLSRPVEALRSSPAFHGAAMDGVAVRAEDTFTASPDLLFVWKSAGKPFGSIRAIPSRLVATP